MRNIRVFSLTASKSLLQALEQYTFPFSVSFIANFLTDENIFSSNDAPAVKMMTHLKVL